MSDAKARERDWQGALGLGDNAELAARLLSTATGGEQHLDDASVDGCNHAGVERDGAISDKSVHDFVAKFDSVP